MSFYMSDPSQADDPWMLADGMPALDQPSTSYLKIDEISGVEPLGSQFGMHPRQCVPKKLHDPLFAQPEPTPDEINQWGAPVAVPRLRTYAITHAEKFQSASGEIESSGLPHRCLFTGDTAEKRKDEAPYLIELDADADFTRRLFTHDPKMPSNMTSVHLWHTEPGMYIRSRATFDDTWRHFRHFTRIQNQRGKWLHFHFWEGAVFSEYWREFATCFQRVARFFCARDFSHTYQIFLVDSGTFTQLTPDLDALKRSPEVVRPFSLTKRDYDFFQTQSDKKFKNNVKTRLDRKLRSAPDLQKQVTSTHVDGAFNFIKDRNGGALIETEDCFTLALLAILWGSSAKTILNGPVLNEPLLPISNRIALARKSYLETLRDLKKRDI